ncbi:tripartite tricarboxylate transporter TctB family protein [Limnohabitans sp.]|jgi:putative tricarboxylic transport membrane protein|uniref:tripartite tricarboxylate transporter TctB family protein n=1 Tax=Limnohabitans sp. TaxID=1907725 RepID=UPI0039BD87F4|nr:tripartite tricarboxylate transporter TctB family protein [Comamonadaceae bacterium]
MPEKKSRLPGELTFTLLLLLGSLFLFQQAYGISGFESITSAGVFPMLSALVMVITALVAMSGVARYPQVAPDEGESSSGHFIRRITPPVWALFTTAVVLFMLLLSKLGFVLSAYLFLVLSMRLLGSSRWLFNALLSAVSLAVVYLIFQTVFSVILPKGTWLTGLWT